MPVIVSILPWLLAISVLHASHEATVEAFSRPSGAQYPHQGSRSVHHLGAAFVSSPFPSKRPKRSKYVAGSRCYNTNDDTADGSASKRIVLIRHGCTHMNEYLSEPGSRWGDPNFREPEDATLFKDSPLSPRGIRQAQRLSARLGHLLEGRPGADIDISLHESDQNIMNEIELIVASPLTRALQTVELGLLPHISPEAVSDPARPQRQAPVVALPLASERVYLISDIGQSTSELSSRFPYVDFESEFGRCKDAWWFTLSDESDYEEWRPIGEGQTYSCPGEPEHQFNRRMTALYDWLDAREEATIALVAHWGVIDWLIGADFENCEMRVVPFGSMERTGFKVSDEEAAQIFSKGEKSVISESGQ